ncbi:MAG: helix-turn-helix domain-containing protein [Bacteroidetes bacterium]|nr:helix-turn-helix domain-containing protein [Bacteroidota bacterium]MBU1580731.1 helix-turn-helix domain-containing protein [Bacteroidota bacterium]MBU2557049.1 helix-turn-helix domain-containing protein [Bacteroidota bacterium]
MREALYELKTELKKVSLFKKEVLSLAEASQLTGISASDLYKRTSNRSIPFFKPSGKLIFFRRTELEAWLTSNRVSTVMEIEEKAMKFQICKN